MGRRGPVTKKTGERSHSHAAPPVVVELVPKPADPPPPPAKLLKSTREAWDRYWQSDVSAAATEATWPAIYRYFTYLDEWERSMSVLRSGHRLVAGSQGQPVMNPLATYMQRLDGSIAKLETELGLTPMGRARLGITTGHAALTMADVNRMTSDQSERPLLSELDDFERFDEA